MDNERIKQLQIFGYGLGLITVYLIVLHSVKAIYNPEFGVFCLWLIPTFIFVLWVVGKSVVGHILYFLIFVALIGVHYLLSIEYNLHSKTTIVLTCCALFFYGLARFSPRLLSGFYDIWMKGAHAISFVITNIVLTGLYLIAFVPAGIIMRLVRKDPLDRKINKGSESYWSRRTDEFDKDRCTKQF